MTTATGNDWTLHHGDCLEVMPTLPAGSVDLIASDLPYGQTQCAWDSVIPFVPLWECFKHVLKPGGAIVLTASQPFTSALVMSNPKWFKYEWIWEKSTPTSFLVANYQPLRSHETISVFSDANACWAGRDNLMPYYPQGLSTWGRINRRGTAGSNYSHAHTENTQEFTGYPRSVLRFPNDATKYHPTQKPVALFAYLIRTYSNPGETVLDCTAGSATTGVAALQERRKFIGIEKDAEYFRVASERLKTAAAQEVMAI